MADHPFSVPTTAKPSAKRGTAAGPPPRAVGRLVPLATVVGALAVVDTVASFIVSDPDWRELVACSAAVILVAAGLVVLLAWQVRGRKDWARAPLGVLCVLGALAALAELLVDLIMTVGWVELGLRLDGTVNTHPIGTLAVVAVINLTATAALIAIAVTISRETTVSWCQPAREPSSSDSRMPSS